MSKGTSRDGFVNMVSRIGVGADNSVSAGQYTLDLLTRNRYELEAMYRGNWLAGIMIDNIADDMLRAKIVIHGADPGHVSDLMRSMIRKKLWDAMLELVKWGRLYGGAAAIIEIDGQDPSTPLRMESIGRDQFIGLRVYDRWHLQPDLTELTREGLPVRYGVLAGDVVGSIEYVAHHSRVIRYTGIDLPRYQQVMEQYWGESVLERIKDRLIWFDTVTASSAQLVNQAHVRTVSIDGLRDLLAAGKESDLVSMFSNNRKLQSSESIFLLDKNDAYMTTSYTFSGLSELIMNMAQQLSGASGIPLTRLLGRSPGGLNATGESDIRSYYDMISTSQESRLREPIHRLIIILWRSLFGESLPDDVDFNFSPLWQASNEDQAETAKKIMEGITGAYDTGIIDRAKALTEMRATSLKTGLWSTITDSDIEKSVGEVPTWDPVDREEGDGV